MTKRQHGRVAMLLFLIAMVGLQQVHPAGAVENLAAEKVKLLKNGEKMTVDGIVYDIPKQWRGKKLNAPAYTFEDFKMIPIKYTHNDSKIYILVEAQEALVEMLSQAEEDGVLIQVVSGYRSAAYQKEIFRRMLKEGRTFEDIVRYVAPPGYSRHMLGDTVDFYPSNWSFADTEKYLWLQEHAECYGFYETYSRYNRKDMPWESWEWRYDGR